MQTERIPVGVRGHHALVDADKLPLLSYYAWNYSNGYAISPIMVGDRRTAIGMHRVVMGVNLHNPNQVDHINGNRLDNRRENLRVVDHRANRVNRRSRSGALSAFRCVGWSRDKQRWRARVRVDGEITRLGYFTTEIEAAVAVERWRLAHGPFGWERDPLLAQVEQALREVPLAA